MNTIVDYAKQGVEGVGELARNNRPEINNFSNLINGLLRVPRTIIEADTADGVKKSLEVVGIPVSGERSMQLLRMLSISQAPGYLGTGNRTVHGMLSPNYDESGERRKNTIRFQSVIGGFTIRNGVWLPEPNNALYLAGATGLETQGSGSHSRPHSIDPEHKLTVYGAASVGDISVAKKHAQHDLRKRGGSVARGLSDGSIGNIFSGKSIEGFSGFGEPIELTGNEKPTANFYIPVGYLDNPEQAFGAYIGSGDITPEQIITGAALRTVSLRGVKTTDFVKAMGA